MPDTPPERPATDATTGGSDEESAATAENPAGGEVGPGPLALVKHLRGAGLSVIDATTHEGLGQVGAGRQPHALAVHPGGRWGYVPYMGSNTLEVLDLHRLEVAATLETVGTAPVGATLTRTGQYLLVSCYGGLPHEAEPGLAVFDTGDGADCSLVAQRPLGKAAGLVTDVRNEVWVALKDEGTVVRLAGEPPFDELARYDLPGQPQDLSYAPEYGLLGVNDVGDDSVTFIDTLEGTVRARVPAPDPRGGTAVPAVDRWFVGDTEGDGVTVVDLDAVRDADGGALADATERVSLGTSTAFTDVTPDGSLLAVDAYEDDRVTFLDPRSQEVVDRVTTGGEPHHPQFGADGSVCYVPNVAADTVSVVDVDSLSLLTDLELPADSAPSGCFCTDRRTP
ncbi:cytochrome D1 domain-containing protein [Halobacteriales archaeon Cl-PHB]